MTVAGVRAPAGAGARARLTVGAGLVGLGAVWPDRVGAAQVVDPPGSARASAPADLRAVWAVAGVTVPAALARGRRVDLSAYGVRVTAPSSAAGLVEARFHLGPHLTLAPAYAYLGAARPGAPGYREHRPRVDLTGALTVAGVGLAARAMAERRLSNVRDWTVLRGRIRAERALTVRGREVARPFAYVEPFYDASSAPPGAAAPPTAGWFRRWTAAGASHAFGPHLYAELYYLRQSERRGPGADADVLGVTLLVRPRGAARVR